MFDLNCFEVLLLVEFLLEDHCIVVDEDWKDGKRIKCRGKVILTLVLRL